LLKSSVFSFAVKELWSNIIPKMRTVEFRVNVWVDTESRKREIDELLPETYKYKFGLEGFRQRIFNVMQGEI